MLKIGDIIGEQYRLERLLGEGGYGSVYEATRLNNVEQRVALKVLHKDIVDDEEQVERFYREAQTIQSLSHPNTVRLYDFGQTKTGDEEHEQWIYMALECLEGESLQEILDAGTILDSERIARITSQILRSLMEAHGQGIIHRDIKPSNIFLLADSNTGYDDFVKLLDFGIAKNVSPLNSDQVLTHAGAIMGTPAYLAPEQASGASGKIGPWTDIYALGLVMAEAMLGEPIYKSAGLIACLEQASPDPVPLPQNVIDSPLGSVIVRATQKLPEQRYPDTRSMLTELESTLTSASAFPLSSQPSQPAIPVPAALPPSAPPVMVPPPEPSPPQPARLWLYIAIPTMLVLVALCAVGAIGLGAGGGLWLSSQDLEPVAAEKNNDDKKTKKKKPKKKKKKKKKASKAKEVSAKASGWTSDDIKERLKELDFDYKILNEHNVKQDSINITHINFQIETKGEYKAFTLCMLMHHYSNDSSSREAFRKPYRTSPIAVLDETKETSLAVSCQDKDKSARLLRLLK